MNPKPELRLWGLDAVQVFWGRSRRMHLFCPPWARCLVVNITVCLACPHRPVLGLGKTLLSLKIVLGADVSSHGLNPGPELWLYLWEERRETATGRRLESWEGERNQGVPCVTKQQGLHVRWKSGTKKPISLWNLLLYIIHFYYLKKL